MIERSRKLEPCELETLTHGCVSSEGWHVQQEINLPG